MTRPASALIITAAASRKVALGAAGAGADAPAGPGGAWRATGWAPPAGNTLSVSWRMTLMFFSSVAQNLLSEVLRTVVMEPFAPAAPPTPAPPPPEPAMLPIWEDTPVAPAVSRSMLT